MYFGNADVEMFLKESENCDLIIMFKSTEEAKRAAKEFGEKAGNKVKFVANWTTIRTESKNIIYFKSVGTTSRCMDGYRGRVIIHIPELEITSKQSGHVCTMRQLQEKYMN